MIITMTIPIPHKRGIYYIRENISEMQSDITLYIDFIENKHRIIVSQGCYTKVDAIKDAIYVEKYYAK